MQTPTRVRILFILLAGRLIFHALYVPVYEGPDEPFHLGRAATIADDSLRDGILGDRLPVAIASSIRAHPCGPDLGRKFGCPPFRRGGAFNVLGPDSRDGPPLSVVNYEAHQPPLYYAASAPILAPISSPVSRILAMRLVSVLLVLAAIAFPMRRLAAGHPESVSVAVLLFLLLPGAAEALSRVSNDAAIFLWTAVIVERLCSRSRASVIVLLIAVGPLLKLTAFPVVALAVSALWLGHRRSAAVIGSVASLSVFCVQMLRGWSWGGTYELNRVTRAAGPDVPSAMGLLRSIYGFVKTVFWLGGWSGFRAPSILVLCWFVVLLVLAVRQLHRSDGRRFEVPPIAHAAGAGVAAAGFIVMAVLNAKLFGQWGGLGGWYVWAWTPWLALALRPALDFGRAGTAGLASFVVASNALWALSANRLYGP